MRIGFLGLGHMGTPMARNLLEAGHTVTVYNRTRGKAKALVASGAGEAVTVAEAVKNAEVVITMLSGDTAVAAAAYGPDGLIENMPPKAIHLCMTTIDVETSAGLASAHSQANQGYVAAPIFGRASAAASRHLWIVAGGPEPQMNRCLPIFEALGRGFTRVGPKAALAHALKMGGNVITMAMEMAVSEILAYAEKAGATPADYLRLLNTAIFKSHMVDEYGSVMARPSFDPADQTLDLAANEMLLDLQASKGPGLAIPLADQVNARLQAASARGWREKDLEVLSKASTLEAGKGESTGAGTKISSPSPAVLNPAAQSSPEPALDPTSREAAPRPQEEPRPTPPMVPEAVRTVPQPRKSTSSDGIADPASTGPRRKPPVMVKGSPALPQPAEPAGSEEVVSSTQRATPPIPPALAKAPSSQEQPETPEDSIVIHDLKAVIIKPDTPAVTQDKVHPPTSTEPTPTAGVVSSSPASEKDQPVRPTAAGSDSSKGGASSRRVNSLDHFPAMNGEESVNLDLEQTSHFELIKGRVWAWSGGKCYETPWRRLSEVELAFNHLLFLLIQRDVLLRPEAVIDLRFNLLGGAKARIGENMELEVNRSAAPRLKELLGL